MLSQFDELFIYKGFLAVTSDRQWQIKWLSECFQSLRGRSASKEQAIADIKNEIDTIIERNSVKRD
jgi:hypothetical protein